MQLYLKKLVSKGALKTEYSSVYEVVLVCPAGTGGSYNRGKGVRGTKLTTSISI
jgi:hypothetical protein